MSAKHILSLEIPKVANCEIFSINDSSTYADNLGIDCEELLITAPGFNSPSLISVTHNFNLNLNACALNLQTVDCGTERAKLPDGVYIIKYSVSPNDKAYVEYNHLRVTSLLNLYYETLCYLNLNDCEPYSEEMSLIVEMKYIRTLIDAAIAKVEYCHDSKSGMDLYDYAKKRLNKISCKTAGC